MKTFLVTFIVFLFAVKGATLAQTSDNSGGNPAGDTQSMKAGAKFRDCAECPEMIVVPPGSFLMGSPPGEKGGNDYQRPRHRVTIGYNFAVGVYEVTFAEWDACVETGDCFGRGGDDEGWGRGNRPVINVSWWDAQVFVGWLKFKTGKVYRLLSEAEWEYMARAGTTTRFWWGEEAGHNNANCKSCGSKWDKKQTAPVGSFRPNAFGIYDTSGNVEEMVEDCNHESYILGEVPNDGSVWEKIRIDDEILKLFSKKYREKLGSKCDWIVVRNGNWEIGKKFSSSARRGSAPKHTRGNWKGFRVARGLD